MNLEKDGKDKFSKNIYTPPSCHEGKHQQTPLQPLDHSSLKLFRGTSSCKCLGPSLDIFCSAELNKGELGFGTEGLGVG